MGTKILRNLPEIDCFVARISSFSSPQSCSESDKSDTLLSYEELEEMYEEQDKIEEEAMIFDAGDLAGLRKMAKGTLHTFRCVPHVGSPPLAYSYPC